MRLDTRNWRDGDAEEDTRADAPGPDPLGHELVADCMRRALGPETADIAADALMAKFGGLSGVFSASPEALASTPGMTADAAADLRRVQALAVRLAQAEIAPGCIISSWAALLAYLRTALRHDRREQFRVLFLDKRLHLIRDEQLSRGTLDHAPVYPREVMRRALELCAASLILVHNHPTGEPTPSGADITITKEIVQAGRALKVQVHDHLIVGRDGVASFKTLGLL